MGAILWMLGPSAVLTIVAVARMRNANRESQQYELTWKLVAVTSILLSLFAFAFLQGQYNHPEPSTPSDIFPAPSALLTGLFLFPFVLFPSFPIAFLAGIYLPLSYPKKLRWVLHAIILVPLVSMIGTICYVLVRDHMI